MICPKCDWKMTYYPQDQIMNYMCSRKGCEFMATDEWMQKITPEMIAQIKKDVRDTITFRQKQSADREIQAIERARKEVEDKKTVYDMAREHKKLSSLEDFTKETKE